MYVNVCVCAHVHAYVHVCVCLTMSLWVLMAAVLRTLNTNFYGVHLFLALFLVAFIKLIPDFVQEVQP